MRAVGLGGRPLPAITFTSSNGWRDLAMKKGTLLFGKLLGLIVGRFYFFGMWFRYLGV
ncbi:hypothetical protein FTV88_1192 [Heliorestis convoluta]|uniref:Uncharacterized protein n=1 Tax=Heliorestis convoluta TaxID=356322 RepID=A0A5Q2N0M2_9FIRM|nr:hypothetical protein FTV88_1192 [Heliorestis convoluta]